MKYDNLIQIDDATYRYEDNGVRFFILIGSKRALLIDSGMNVKNIKDVVLSVTNKPFTLINTHADPDYIGANNEFSSFMMHPFESSNYYNDSTRVGTIIPVYDKSVIDLGDRELEVILILGHTPGSIALLDKKNRVLYSGDSIQDDKIFLFGQMREINAYISSLERLNNIKSSFDTIYPSHGTPVLNPSFIDRLLVGVRKVKNKEINYKQINLFGKTLSLYDIDCAKILTN